MGHSSPMQPGYRESNSTIRIVPTGLDHLNIAGLAGSALHVRPNRRSTPMHEALEPTRDPGWVLSHEGYNILTERPGIALCVRQRVLGHARRSLGQPGPNTGYPGWALADGHLGRAATSPACSTCPTSSRRCLRWCLSPTGPRSHPAGRNTAAGARGRSTRRHPQARPAPRLAAVGLDASHPAGITFEGASCASCRWRTARRACNSCSSPGPRRHRREAGGRLRDGRPRHGADAAGAGPRRLARGGDRQGRGDDRGRDVATSAAIRSP